MAPTSLQGLPTAASGCGWDRGPAFLGRSGPLLALHWLDKVFKDVTRLLKRGALQILKGPELK